MKGLMCGAALVAASVVTSAASEQRAVPRDSSAFAQFTYGWAAMPPLPRRYQNHCIVHDGRFVCSDHCGVDFQIYYCSKTVTGCCHVGRGYCDGTGKLRCSPALF